MSCRVDIIGLHSIGWLNYLAILWDWATGGEMRKLGRPAMLTKHVTLALWAMLTFMGVGWMRLTPMEPPWQDTATPSHHVHRFDRVCPDDKIGRLPDCHQRCPFSGLHRPSKVSTFHLHWWRMLGVSKDSKHLYFLRIFLSLINK